MNELLDLCKRYEAQRDDWKARCERQAEQIKRLRESLAWALPWVLNQPNKMPQYEVARAILKETAP